LKKKNDSTDSDLEKLIASGKKERPGNENVSGMCGGVSRKNLVLTESWGSIGGPEFPRTGGGKKPKERKKGKEVTAGEQIVPQMGNVFELVMIRQANCQRKRGLRPNER